MATRSPRLSGGSEWTPRVSVDSQIGRSTVGRDGLEKCRYFACDPAWRGHARGPSERRNRETTTHVERIEVGHAAAHQAQHRHSPPDAIAPGIDGPQL